MCPVHGVRKAVGVIQWPQELSDEMRAGIDARWFYRGRYTSGNCADCGLTLSVTRKKPVIK